MKMLTIACLTLLYSVALQAQKIKPCDNWLTDFIQIEPKTSDGTPINKYVNEKLISDTSLKNMGECMVGLMIYSNCSGELTYEKQDYRNNPATAAQCKALLQKVETIMNGMKVIKPGTIGHEQKDFIFKLVVHVKHDGKPVSEILY